jgi:DNA (cytosine-5)-methyltransferase 1
LAAEWAGFKTVGQCEIADYPTKVLEKHWLNVPRWRDVRDVTAEAIQNNGIKEITLLSGGFPCQPHSLAGKRKASADERDLWGEFARVICEVRPRWVLAENVPGLFSSEDGRFFGRVLRDLDEMGYYAGWCCYGVSDVGAPHERERVFIIAHSNSQRCQFGGMLNTEHEFPHYKEWDTAKNIRTWDGWKHWLNKNFQNGYWERAAGRVFRVDDGASIRSYRIKSLGNMVVPQQVYPILQAIADIELTSEQEAII